MMSSNIWPSRESHAQRIRQQSGTGKTGPLGPNINSRTLRKTRGDLGLRSDAQLSKDRCILRQRCQPGAVAAAGLSAGAHRRNTIQESVEEALSIFFQRLSYNHQVALGIATFRSVYRGANGSVLPSPSPAHARERPTAATRLETTNGF